VVRTDEWKTRIGDGWKAAFPTRAMTLLLGIGVVDLIATAWLHHQGLIVELNPLMRPLIETSEALFAAVKGGTLVLAWYGMWRYAQTNLDFVRQAAIYGAAGYVAVWSVWFIAASR
jgi:hypothetical protein